MILCPNCGHQEWDGALYCSDCGSLLVKTSGKLTHANQSSSTGAIKAEISTPPPPSRNTSVALLVLESNKMVPLPLSGRYEYTIGRRTEDPPVLPDVDLTPYQAYEKGLSRLHAKVLIDPQNVTIMDLNSVNGTRLNGTRLVPFKGYTVNHGDILVLGKLKVKVLIQIQ